MCPKEGCGRSFKVQLFQIANVIRNERVYQVERDVRNHVKNFHDSVNVQKRELLLRDRVCLQHVTDLNHV